MKSFYVAVQMERGLWLVIFISELGSAEMQTMISAEFIQMIAAQAEIDAEPTASKIDGGLE